MVVLYDSESTETMVLRKEIFFLVHGGLLCVLETTETVSRSLEQGASNLSSRVSFW